MKETSLFNTTIKENKIKNIFPLASDLLNTIQDDASIIERKYNPQFWKR